MDGGQSAAFLRALGCEKIKERGKWVKSTCPLARWKHSGGRDKHPSFAISIDPGDASHCRCLGCGASGALYSLLWKLDYYGVNVEQPFRYLTRHNQPNVLRERPLDPEDLRGRLARISSYELIDPTRVSTFVEETQASIPEADLLEYRNFPDYVVEYISRRGISLASMHAWELGWHQDAKRIVIPIRDLAGKLVALSGRAFDPGMQPKYLHSRFKRDRVLYGEHKLVKGLPCYLCEGFFEVIYLYQLGYQNAVARMGTHLSNDQAARLVEYASSVIVLPDGDPAGRDSAEKILEQLHERVPTKIVEMPDGMDVDKLPPRHIYELLGRPSGSINQFD